MFILFNSYLVGIGLTEELDCSLFAVATFSKYLDCPLVNATDIEASSADTEVVDSPFVNVTWTVHDVYDFIFHFSYFRIDYYGTYSNNSDLSLIRDFNVTRSGQLFISRVRTVMRYLTFECAIMNESTYEWSQPIRLERLNVLWYGKLKPFLILIMHA